MRTHRLVSTCLLAQLVLGAPLAAQHPFRGSLRRSVLLGAYTDSPASPRTIGDVTDMFARLAVDGIADYWSRASRQSIVSNRIEVRGFFHVPQTVATTTGKGRWQRFDDCVAAAAAGGYTAPSGNGVIVVTNPTIDLWGSPGFAFGGIDHDVGAYGHEVGHGLGLNHSFNDDPTYRTPPGRRSASTATHGT